MAGEHKLTTALLLPQTRDDPLSNEAIVEIVFRLVDDEWRGRLMKEEQQNGSGSLARGQRVEWLPLLRLTVRCGVQFDFGCRPEVELFNMHQKRIAGMGELVRLRVRNPVPADELIRAAARCSG